MKAVRFDDYGGTEVLEAAIRAGVVREIFPATFPSGEGSDLAGVVAEVGAGVTGVATVRAVAPTAAEAVLIAGAGGGVRKRITAAEDTPVAAFIDLVGRG
jgi:NADPH:quinone reductase-like Zn-dependent oxidoreductase